MSGPATAVKRSPERFGGAWVDRLAPKAQTEDLCLGSSLVDAVFPDMGFRSFGVHVAFSP